MASTSVVSPLQFVQNVLSLQSEAGRPSAQICSAITKLKDLCEIQTPGAALDWRRGTGASTSGGGSSGGGGNSRPLFRGPGTGASLSPGMPRSSSNRSFGASTSGGGSPHTPSAGSPFTPSPLPGGTGGPTRYQSMFKNSSQDVEDKILNNIILSKLNKFSGSTYTDVRDFLYQILGSEEPEMAEMVRHFMQLVFKKAATEEVYCPLYAKLLADISSRYKVILEEMQKLQDTYLDIFEDVVEVPEGGDNYEAFVEKNKEKKYRQGYSQFLAELAALEILDLSNLEQTFRRLFDLMLRYAAVPDKKALVEEYADCLVRMSKVLKKKSSPFFLAARNSLSTQSASALTELIDKKEMFPSLSQKARFILMDVKDNLSA